MPSSQASASDTYAAVVPNHGLEALPMPDPTDVLAKLAAERDCLTADGPPSLTQLAAQVALMSAALVTLADSSSYRDNLQP